MLIDLNNEKAKSVRYDVCVFGGGPAGITLARTLAAKGKLVALLEGGDLEYSEESQSIYDGKSIGLDDWGAPRYCRPRYLGGASNHWGGRCGTFDPIDFESRDYFGLPGWPIALDEVLHYLPKALEIVDIPPNALPYTRPSFGSNQFRYSEKALSRPVTRFGTKYLNELKSSANIHLYINANLVNLDLQEIGKSIKSTEVRNYRGESFVFIANKYVIAFGGAENARMLLNADKQMKNGIGNHSGWLGRCFMDHLGVNLGRFVAEDQKIIQGGLELNPTETLMRAHGIGNGILTFEPDHVHNFYGHLRILQTGVRDAICKSKTATEFSRKIMDFDCPGDGIVDSMIEQSPNPDSRIMLDRTVDKFGLRRIIIDWRISEADSKTIRTLGMELAKEAARMKIARLQLRDYILDDQLEITPGRICHHMGTTRMSADPRFGVVDENSRVHGFSNLYIAGSSVFPTGGGINPTLTLIMLTLRLGDHLNHFSTNRNS